jgi:hypothetical protein
MTTIRDLGWWYWVLTVGLLSGGLLARPEGILLAMMVCAIQIAHVLWLTGDVTAFPVQVRVAYLALLIAGTWEPLQWIHWVQLTGTSARVVIGYCLLARTLSLTPWNRVQPLTLDLMRQTFFSLQTALPPCGAVFSRMSLERVAR